MLNLVLLAAVAAMFGFNPVAGRALAGIVEPGQLTLIRWIVAGILIAALALARGHRERWEVAPSSWIAIIGLGALGMGFCSFAAFEATKTTTATNVSLLYATTAAMVLAAEWMIGRSKPTVMLILGVGLCLLGAAFVITKGHLAAVGNIAFTVGDLWALAGTVAWTVYTMSLNRMQTGLTRFSMFTITAIGGALFALPMAAVETATHGIHPLSAADLVWILAMIMLSGVGAFLIYSVCVSRVGPLLSSAALTLNPLATAIFAVALVGETLAWFHAVGGALVIGGLVMINLDKARTTGAVGGAGKKPKQ